MSRQIWLWVLCISVLLVGLVSLPGRLFIGDPYAWREEARWLVLRGQLHVEAEAALSMPESGQYFVQNPHTQLWYSKYGILNSLLNAIPLWVEKKLTGAVPRWDSPKRRLILGCFFLGISLLIAILLFRIGERYTDCAPAITLFVLLAFYATFNWHYLRATNTESTQLLLFCAYYWQMLRYHDGGPHRDRALLWGWLFAGGLVLTKISFLLLLPVTAAVVLYEMWRACAKSVAAVTLYLALPMAIIAGAIGAVNWWKFGSPLYSGYHAWREGDVSLTEIRFDGFWGLLFSEQWSLFSHFPLLLLAFFGLREFYRRFRFDLLFSLFVFLVFFFVIARMPLWKGEWSYGPRYFLFLLPLLSLPALFPLRDFFTRSAISPRKIFIAVVFVPIFTYSTYLQFQLERLDGFFYYWTRPPEECRKDAELDAYFSGTHYGRIAATAFAARENPESLWYTSIVRRDCPGAKYEHYLKDLNTWLHRGNFYWFYPRE